MLAPKLKRDWKGLTVRAVRDLRNGYLVIPAGTLLTVEENRAGLQLTGEPCQSCGVAVRINRVAEHEVEIVGGRERQWERRGSPYYRCPVCQAGDVDPFVCGGGVAPGDPPHRRRRAQLVERHGRKVKT